MTSFIPIDTHTVAYLKAVAGLPHPSEAQVRAVARLAVETMRRECDADPTAFEFDVYAYLDPCAGYILGWTERYDRIVNRPTRHEGEMEPLSRLETDSYRARFGALSLRVVGMFEGTPIVDPSLGCFPTIEPHDFGKVLVPPELDSYCGRVSMRPPGRTGVPATSDAAALEAAREASIAAGIRGFLDRVAAASAR